MQHSGSGKGNQYFLRGFNLDHGTDFTTYVDGMPGTSARTATARAISMAADSFITTIDPLDHPFVAFESGEYGWGRLAAGGSVELDRGEYFKPTSFGTMSLTLFGYEGDWHPTEQIPERVIGSSVCPDAFCASRHDLLCGAAQHPRCRRQRHRLLLRGPEEPQTLRVGVKFEF